MTMTSETTIRNEDSFIPRSEEVMRQREQRQEFIPLSEAGIVPPNDESDVFNIRINNQQMLYDLYTDWGGMTLTKNNEGERGFKKSAIYDLSLPPLTPRGARHIVSLLKLLNNPSILGKTGENEHKIIRKHILNSVAEFLTDSAEVNMSYVERDNFYSFMEAYINAQLSRTVRGHESQNMITNVREERGEHSVTQSSGKKVWFGGSSNTDQRGFR